MLHGTSHGAALSLPMHPLHITWLHGHMQHLLILTWHLQAAGCHCYNMLWEVSQHLAWLHAWGAWHGTSWHGPCKACMPCKTSNCRQQPKAGALNLKPGHTMALLYADKNNTQTCEQQGSLVHGLKNPTVACMVNTWATVTDMVATNPSRLAPDTYLDVQAHTKPQTCNHMGS